MENELLKEKTDLMLKLKEIENSTKQRETILKENIEKKSNDIV